MVIIMGTTAILTIFSILQGTILCQEIGMKNVALNQPANQTFAYTDPNGDSNTWVADRAVDDCLIQDPYTSPYCCSATVAGTDNYWHLNLQDDYQVQRIVIYGRTKLPDGQTQLEGFKLYIYNSINSHPQEVTGVQEAVENSNKYMVDFENTKHIKEIRLTLAITLTLFEVQVFAPCDDRHYGINCTLKCGNCFENATCNKTTGDCFGGCSAGWKSPLCNENCDNGTWGVNCINNCSQCRNDTVCDAVNGECQFGCKPGWKGNPCNETCIDGSFGDNCSSKCGHCHNGTACKKTTGHCPAGCDSGWKLEDLFCNTACDDGFYGINCISTCGECHNNATCDKTTGVCPGGCKLGLMPPLCNSSCDNYSWGVNCTNECGQCLNSTVCDVENGTCLSGCNPGWKGVRCNEECEAGTFGANCLLTCGHCLELLSCNRITGYCRNGCSSGWKREDPYCNTTCDDGFYGMNCTSACGKCHDNATCYKTTGMCPGGCKIGFKPPLCNAVCDDETWGINCSMECQNCLNDTKCDTINGYCSYGCTAGWRGPTCNTNCTIGTWGLNCLSNCGFCKDSKLCDTENGHCPAGCIQSYEPPLCEKEKLQDVTNGNAAAIGGSVAGVVVICAIIGAIVVWKIRKSRKKSQSYHKDQAAMIKSLLKKDDSLTQKLDVQINQTIGLHVGEEERLSAQDNGNNIQLSPRVKETKEGFKANQDKTVYSTTAIPIAELRTFCRNNCFQEGPLYNEFDKLPRGMLYGAMAAKDPDNMKMNRYKDMIAYDKNRVKLPVTDTAVGSDYINASYVEGYQKGRMKYIASQGVMDNIIDAFWLMIWSSDIHNIIMLTNCTEGGRLKCKQYWPNEGEHQYGGICVSLEEEQRYAEYTIRTFSCKRGTNGAVRTIIQFHYTAWPDKNVPNYPLSLVRFWNRVKSSQTAAIIPWLVHCSAGVGRTGTFIALDCLYEQAQMEGKVDIFKSVNYLREQRVNMVQTPAQYVFLYQAVLDAVQPTGQLCSTEGFSDLLVDLMKQSPDSQMTNLEVEFKKLQMDRIAADQVMEMDNQNIYHNLTFERFAHSLLPENNIKTRDDNVLPDDQYRPLLGTFVEGHNNYINAVYLETHRHSAGLIITQTPLPDTMIDFYRLLWDNHVATVVMMDSDHDNEKVGCYWNLSSTTTSIEPFSLVLTSEVEEEFYLSREIQISLRGETRHLKMFQYTDWSTRSSNPQNTGSMLQLLDSVSKSGNSPMDAPIVVHCLNGADKSGLFCVLWTVFERMKEDNEVAVADTVKMMRVRRPQIIPTLEQYKFCYTVIQEYLESSTTYANVL